ncbi:MAG: histidine phosphatase family protein [Bacteroidota bacterium]|nr:histidine phosphatase family protein [Bacteroidota bacterium]
MKELVILRHAKSNRTYMVNDINRPLSQSGIERIQIKCYQKRDFFIDAEVIISSPAIRALHTAVIVIRELGISMEKLIIDEQLYTFSGSSIIDYVYALDERWSKVVLVGHNPAFTEVINHFSDVSINQLKTSGFAKISFNEDQWSNLFKGEVVLGQKKKD